MIKKQEVLEVLTKEVNPKSSVTEYIRTDKFGYCPDESIWVDSVSDYVEFYTPDRRVRDMVVAKLRKKGL